MDTQAYSTYRAPRAYRTIWRTRELSDGTYRTTSRIVDVKREQLRKLRSAATRSFKRTYARYWLACVAVFTLQHILRNVPTTTLDEKRADKPVKSASRDTVKIVFTPAKEKRIRDTKSQRNVTVSRLTDRQRELVDLDESRRKPSCAGNYDRVSYGDYLSVQGKDRGCMPITAKPAHMRHTEPIFSNSIAHNTPDSRDDAKYCQRYNGDTFNLAAFKAPKPAHKAPENCRPQVSR